MKIKFHQPIISAHAENPYLNSKELNGFFREIKGNPYISNENNIILIVRDGVVINTIKVKDYIETDLSQEITCYDGITGISAFGGTGFLLIDQGEETNLTNLNKVEIKKWVKSNWKEGLMIDWEDNVFMDLKPTRETFSLKKEFYEF